MRRAEFARGLGRVIEAEAGVVEAQADGEPACRVEARAVGRGALRRPAEAEQGALDDLELAAEPGVGAAAARRALHLDGQRSAHRERVGRASGEPERQVVALRLVQQKRAALVVVSMLSQPSFASPRGGNTCSGDLASWGWAGSVSSWNKMGGLIVSLLCENFRGAISL